VRFWTQLIHEMKAKLAIAIMVVEVAIRHGELHQRLRDPCTNQSSVSDDVKLNRHTAVDAAVIGMSGASESIPTQKIALSTHLTDFQASHVTNMTDDTCLDSLLVCSTAMQYHVLYSIVCSVSGQSKPTLKHDHKGLCVSRSCWEYAVQRVWCARFVTRSWLLTAVV